MATQEDVRRIALSLPQTSESADHFGFGVLNKGKLKGFAWAWNERIEPKKPKVPNAGVLVVHVASLAEKEELLAADPEKFFVVPGLHAGRVPARSRSLETRGAIAAAARGISRTLTATTASPGRRENQAIYRAAPGHTSLGRRGSGMNDRIILDGRLPARFRLWAELSKCLFPAIPNASRASTWHPRWTTQG
ncbi:MAG TPA: hypothetical protein VFO01_06875 [Trebonia sp.]|nr:hypothetical protein [Trebonia sp.]